MRPKIDWYRPSTRNIGEALIDPDTSAENIFAKTIGFTFSGEKLLIGFTYSCFPKIWKLGNDFFGEKLLLSMMTSTPTRRQPCFANRKADRRQARTVAHARAHSWLQRGRAFGCSCASKIRIFGKKFHLFILGKSHT